MMEPTPLAPSSCARRSIGTWPFHLRSRHRSVTLADMHAIPHERSVVDSVGFFSAETWLKEHFHAKETFNADSDEVPGWVLKGLLLVGIRSRFELCRNPRQCAPFFCDLNVSVCGGRERVLALSEDLLRYSVRPGPAKFQGRTA